MAEPFKNLINREGVAAMRRQLRRAWAGFDGARFEALALDGLEALELKARAQHLSAALEATLPEDFDLTRKLNIPLDAERNVAKLPWGLELPLAPFFGVMGVAPPAHWGRITTIVPRAHGGNLDLKELRPGASLHLPVHVPGALF